MFIFAHLAAGLVVSKLTGSYWALLGALVLDIDHVLYYFSRVFVGRRAWRSLFDRECWCHERRELLHSLIVWLVVSGLLWWFAPQVIAVAISAGYLLHIVLDILDAASMQVLWPLPWRISGMLPFDSWAEQYGAIVLVLVFLVL